MNTEYSHRPETPPEESRRKSTVLADLNGSQYTMSPTGSVRTGQPFPATGMGGARAQDNTPTVTDGVFGRNANTRRIERRIIELVQWERPTRSGITLALIMASIILSRQYSLIQIGAAFLTVAVGLNLLYVTFVIQTQHIFSDRPEAVHPYSGVIGHKNELTTIDKRLFHHYSSLIVDISETIIRALARIVFIEDTLTSAKWFVIFWLTWTISAHVSSRIIIAFFTLSAFIFPRLYLSNKGIVDAHLHQGEAIIKNHIQNGQALINDRIADVSAKIRVFFAQAGTTHTDAKNSLRNTSVSLKEE